MNEFLTVAEIAEVLKINQMTVRNWIDRGELRAVRVGSRRVRVPRAAFDEFLAAGETAVTRAREDEPSAEPNATEDDWARLGAALGKSSAALADEDRSALSQALGSVADAAARLADALGSEK